MRFGWIIILILYCQVILAQALQPSFRSYTTDHGLANNEVHRIIQDAKDHVWFATGGGVSVFDGYQFKNYGIQQGLGDAKVIHIHEDHRERIWCVTLTHGLYCIDGNRIAAYEFNDSLRAYLHNSVIIDFAIEKDGTIWCGSKDRGLLKISPKGKVEHRFRASRPGKYSIWIGKHLLTYGITAIALGQTPNLHKGIHYILTPNPRDSIELARNRRSELTVNLRKYQNMYLRPWGNDLFILDESDEVRSISLPGKIVSITKTNDGSLWVGLYRNGVVKLKADSERLTIESRFLFHESISHVFMDDRGGYWFTSLENGVFYTPTLNVLHYVNPKLSSRAATSLTTNGKHIFVGTRSGEVLSLEQTGSIESIYPGPDLEVSSLEWDEGSKRLWIDISGIGSYQTDQKKMAYHDSPIRTADAIAVGKDGNVWFGNSKGLHLLNEGTVSTITDPSNGTVRVQTIHLADSNHPLIGTPQGLYRYSNGTFEAVGRKFEELSRSITSIARYKDGWIFGTAQDGLLFLKNKALERISTKNGLVSNQVTKVFPSSEFLWVGTKGGVSRIRLHEGTWEIRNLTKENGLTARQVNDLCVIDDQLWVASNKGLSLINGHVFSRSYNPIPTSINAIVVNHHDTIFDQPTFKHNENHITFHYKAISYALGDQLLYKYRLIGQDTTWYYTQNTTLTFPNLRPGDYAFEIIAKNENGLWNPDITSVSFTIYPPWWKTWWFRSILLVVFFATVYLFFRIRILTYNRDVVRELLRALLARLRPKSSAPPYFLVKSVSDGSTVKIVIDKLLYLKSDDNYVNVVCTEQNVLVRAQLKDLTEQLGTIPHIIRVHRSYTVNMKAADAITLKEIKLNNISIPVGRAYRENVKGYREELASESV